MSTNNNYGELKIITELTKTKGLNNGKGYSRSLVEKVLRGERRNSELEGFIKAYQKAIKTATTNLINGTSAASTTGDRYEDFVTAFNEAKAAIHTLNHHSKLLIDHGFNIDIQISSRNSYVVLDSAIITQTLH